MSSPPSEDPLLQVAIHVYVLTGVVILLAIIARILMQCTLRNGSQALKIKLELALCSLREGLAPITISQTEVYAAYATAIFVAAVAITSISIFFAMINPLSTDIGSGVSLFTEAGNGHALSIAAVSAWGLVLLTAIVISVRAWWLVRGTFFDREFASLIKRHFKSKKDRSRGSASTACGPRAASGEQFPMLTL